MQLLFMVVAMLTIVLACLLCMSTVHAAGGDVIDVSFDGRSFIVDGDRQLFFGGSFHYPRAPRSEWPTIFQQLKDNGINLIQTYVFWVCFANVHAWF